MAWITNNNRSKTLPYIVRWRDGDKTRSKSFATEAEAQDFVDRFHPTITVDATEEPQDWAPKFHRGANREYIFELPTRVVEFSETAFVRMLDQYSTHGEGWPGKLVATHNDLTEREFRSILKAVGFVKGDFPYTDAMAAEMDAEELAEEIAATRRTDIDRRIMRKQRRALREDAAKWRDLETSVLQYVDIAVDAAISEVSWPSEAKPRDIRRSPSPFALLLPVTDLHIGKKSWGGYGPGEFSTAVAQRRLGEAVDDILAWLPGRPEKIILPVGGDLLQADTTEGKTSRGTPQDMDGTPEQMIVEAWGIVYALVAELLAVAPVQLVYNRGNHDAALSLALFRSLELTYANDPRVTFGQEEHRYSPYQCIEYGAAALGFAHGDGRSKPHELATLMAMRWPAIWARTQFHEWHAGHVHHERVVEDSGVTILTNPSLAGNDRYHELHWPHSAKPKLAAHVYDKKRGRIATIYGVPE